MQILLPYFIPSTFKQSPELPRYGPGSLKVALDQGPSGKHQYPPNVTKHFRYLKWRNPHLYKLYEYDRKKQLYGYGLCKLRKPGPPK